MDFMDYALSLKRGCNGVFSIKKYLSLIAVVYLRTQEGENDLDPLHAEAVEGSQLVLRRVHVALVAGLPYHMMKHSTMYCIIRN